MQVNEYTKRIQALKNGGERERAILIHIKESEERRRKRKMIRRTRVVKRNTGEKRKIIMLL